MVTAGRFLVLWGKKDWRPLNIEGVVVGAVFEG